jgi:hypothetical protein
MKNQEVDNTDSNIVNQVNINNQNAPVSLFRKTRWSKRFERLNTEVLEDERYDVVMEELEYYLTKLDGVDMPTKLEDGGFNQPDIVKATFRKEKYWKKLEKTKFYESSQWINCQLFAKIKMDFEQHVERPLIDNGADLSEVMKSLADHVVNPALNLLNEEGEFDTVLNYTAEDIYGMVYYLTGKCHINWKNYDNL